MLPAAAAGAPAPPVAAVAAAQFEQPGEQLPDLIVTAVKDISKHGENTVSLAPAKLDAFIAEVAAIFDVPEFARPLLKLYVVLCGAGHWVPNQQIFDKHIRQGNLYYFISTNPCDVPKLLAEQAKSAEQLHHRQRGRGIGATSKPKRTPQQHTDQLNLQWIQKTFVAEKATKCAQQRTKASLSLAADLLSCAEMCKREAGDVVFPDDKMNDMESLMSKHVVEKQPISLAEAKPFIVFLVNQQFKSETKLRALFMENLKTSHNIDSVKAIAGLESRRMHRTSQDEEEEEEEEARRRTPEERALLLNAMADKALAGAGRGPSPPPALPPAPPAAIPPPPPVDLQKEEEGGGEEEDEDEDEDVAPDGVEADDESKRSKAGGSSKGPKEKSTGRKKRRITETDEIPLPEIRVVDQAGRKNVVDVHFQIPAGVCKLEEKQRHAVIWKRVLENGRNTIPLKLDMSTRMWKEKKAFNKEGIQERSAGSGMAESGVPGGVGIEEETLRGYVDQRKTAAEILTLLAEQHGINLNRRALRSRLRELGLSTNYALSFNVLCVAVLEVVNLNGPLFGGGMIRTALRAQGITASKSRIRKALAVFDPVWREVRGIRAILRERGIKASESWIQRVASAAAMKIESHMPVPYNPAVQGRKELRDRFVNYARARPRYNGYFAFAYGWTLGPDQPEKIYRPIDMYRSMME
eukprot:tig00020921_g15925.t1